MMIEEALQLKDNFDAFIKLSEIYLISNVKLQESIRNKWPFNREWDLPNQKTLACSVNEKYSPICRIKASLVYLSIAYTEKDKKEIIFSLAVIYNSIKILDYDDKDIFRVIQNTSSEKFKRTLEEFSNRKVEDKSLDAFLLKVRKNRNNEVEILMPWEK